MVGRLKLRNDGITPGDSKQRWSLSGARKARGRDRNAPDTSRDKLHTVTPWQTTTQTQTTQTEMAHTDTDTVTDSHKFRTLEITRGDQQLNETIYPKSSFRWFIQPRINLPLLRANNRITQSLMAEWLNMAIFWNAKDAWLKVMWEGSIMRECFNLVILWTIKETWLQKRGMMREESHWGSDTKEMQGVTS